MSGRSLSSLPIVSLERAISVRSELRDTLKLAAPIVLNQVGHMSMGLVDTLVAGRISTTALAGLGLAANFFWTFTSVCVGCLLALDTYFSQASGAKDQKMLARYLGQSLWSCLFVMVVASAAVLLAAAIYTSFAAPGGTTEAVRVYIFTITWCTPGLFFYFVLQRYWQAQHLILPFTIIVLSANVLNVLGCMAFGLGHWGFPRLGVKGIAISTVVCRYVMLIAGLVFTWRQLKTGPVTWPRIDWVVQKAFFRLGLPAASHTALEIGAFTIATFAVGTLGAVPLAAHHVSLMMAAFTFMFPAGLGAAAAVRVGTFIGAGEPERARLAGRLCIGISIAVMSIFALGYLAIPRFLLGIFTGDQAVVELGIKILMLVALFQIADGIQVSATGALRGLGNTRAAMVANLIGHYPIGLALGFALCFWLGLGAVGLWTGLAAGLVSVAIMLVFTWIRMTRDLAALKPVSAGVAPGPSL